MLPPATRQSSVADIVEALEPLVLVECFEDPAACKLSPSCRLHGVLAEANRAFIEALRAHTIADLVARRRAPLLALTGKLPHS